METTTPKMRLRPTGRLSTVSTVIVAAFILVACSTSKSETDAFADDRPAGVLYNEGLAYLNEGQLEDAADSFTEVDRQHPYSDWARKALIMNAFANYRRSKYDEAVSSAERYLSLYPGSSDAPYAHYLIGSSYFKRIPDVTRDQDETRHAIQSLREIVTQYLDSEYRRRCAEKNYRRPRPDCRQGDADRSLLPGNAASTPQPSTGSRGWLSTIRTPAMWRRPLQRLTEANLALGLVAEAQNAAAILGHNFPDSEWYEDAYQLLQTGGLEPRESEGSLLSRIFPVLVAGLGLRPPKCWSALTIRDIVVIDRLSISFGTGMTVFTGETGAGKSILLDALSLALGARGDASLVRAGAETGRGGGGLRPCRRPSRTGAA